jgi:hypothetical protein
MKRQPKPFSVEIKRSRRSPTASSATVDGRSDNGGGYEPDNGAPRKKRAAKATAEAELVVPAFLKSDKSSFRPTSKLKAQDSKAQHARAQDLRGQDLRGRGSSGRDFTAEERDGVFAAKAASPKPERRQAEEENAASERAAPRILPSLTSGYGVAPQPEAKPAAKGRGRKAALSAAPEPTPTRRRIAKEEAASAQAPSIRAEAGPRQNSGARQRADASLGSSPSRKSATAVKNGFAGPAKFGQRSPVAATRELDPLRGEVARLQTKRRSQLKRRRDEAAFLPRGEHWKRRIHPRAW